MLFLGEKSKNDVYTEKGVISDDYVHGNIPLNSLKICAKITQKIVIWQEGLGSDREYKFIEKILLNCDNKYKSK